MSAIHAESLEPVNARNLSVPVGITAIAHGFMTIAIGADRSSASVTKITQKLRKMV